MNVELSQPSRLTILLPPSTLSSFRYRLIHLPLTLPLRPLLSLMSRKGKEPEFSTKVPTKIRRKHEQFRTMKVGCKKRWNDKQSDAIDSYLPQWHQFSLVDNLELDGRDSKLLTWKRRQTDVLLASDAFKVLPEGVSTVLCHFYSAHLEYQMDLKEAKTIIIRKFTNYRNKELERSTAGVNDRKMYMAMLESATALADLQIISKGRALFKNEMNDAIVKRRDELFMSQVSAAADSEGEDSGEDTSEKRLPLIACYQKALKELWEEADKESWEEKAANEPEDVHE